MAKDIKLDDYGNLDDSTGDLVEIEEVEEIAQFAKTKTLKLYDEDGFAQDTGIGWLTPMLDFETEKERKKLILRGTYLAIPEVTGVPVLTMERPEGTHEKQVVVEMDSIYENRAKVNL